MSRFLFSNKKTMNNHTVEVIRNRGLELQQEIHGLSLLVNSVIFRCDHILGEYEIEVDDRETNEAILNKHTHTINQRIHNLTPIK